MLDEVESPNLPLDLTSDTPPSSFAQQPINYSIALPIASLNINTSQEESLDNIINKNYINDTEEINYKNFKDDILRDLHKDLEEMINRKIKSVEKISEASIESFSLNYLEQINILKNELNSKNLIINKLLETVDKFTNQSSLHSKIQSIPQYTALAIRKKFDSKFLPSLFASSKAFRRQKFSCLFLLAAHVHD